MTDDDRSTVRVSYALTRVLACGLLALLLSALFTASAANRFFLPTGTEVHNSGDPSIRTDSQGNIHMAYPLIASAGAVYAFCEAGCRSEEDVWSVAFPTEEFGAVHTALVALDANDRPHLLFSTYDGIIYAECNGDCRRGGSWTGARIYAHDGDWELTGDAFAIDPQGRPRFLMHAYQAYMGLFAPDPGTRLFACDAADCQDGAAWRVSLISEQSWLQPVLRYDQRGVAHVATVIPVDDFELVAYLRCEADCGNEQVDNWPGIGLANAYSDLYIEEIAQAVAMDITPSGGVRLAYLGDEGGEIFLGYAECDTGCTVEDGSGWAGLILLTGDTSDLGDGISLAVDAQGRPRLAYTVASNILVAYCDGDCVGRSGPDEWQLAEGELADNIPPDDIFLYHNCTVGFWFLRQPALAIGANGLPVVAYRAEDISGGWTSPDPTRPACVSGVDMSMTRLAVLDSY